MIVTVTPNPSIDRTIRVPKLVRGAVIRATSADSEAGGKGVNVSRALAIHGHASVAVVPLSPESEPGFFALLGGAATLRTVPVAGAIRVNVSVIEPDGTVTKLNEPGPRLGPAEVDALVDCLVSLADEAEWVVGCGSLPQEVQVDFYASVARRLPKRVRFAVDADGEALRAALDGRPTLIKPNREELERLVGAPLPSLGDVVEAAVDLVRRERTGGLLVSLGADGAVFVDGAGATHCEARIDDAVNTVGAGDALLAGFLAAGAGAGALEAAVAWAVAACRSPGTQLRRVTPADEAAVVRHDQVRADRLLAA